MANTSAKKKHSELDKEDDDTEERFSKANRNDLEPTVSEVDVKLAEKLDKILQIGTTRRPIFYTNKPRKEADCSLANGPKDSSVVQACDGKLKARHLSKDELKERLTKRYDTLVPELDPNRPNVKLVKILSVSESVELAKSQAKKQMERQMELSSVSGNQVASRGGLGAFTFNDGYETSPRHPATSNQYKKSTLISSRIAHKYGADPLNKSPSQSNEKVSAKTVRFVDADDDNVKNNDQQHDRSDASNSEDDELSDSDCTLTDGVEDEDSLTE